jgi:hypothetical protein
MAEYLKRGRNAALRAEDAVKVRVTVEEIQQQRSRLKRGQSMAR